MWSLYKSTIPRLGWYYGLRLEVKWQIWNWWSDRLTHFPNMLTHNKQEITQNLRDLLSGCTGGSGCDTSVQAEATKDWAKEEAKQESQISTLLVRNEVKPYKRADPKGLYNGTRSCKRLLPWGSVQFTPTSTNWTSSHSLRGWSPRYQLGLCH